MTITELIAKFRAETGDTVEPYLWDDEVVTSAFNEAVDEAAIRADLIFDTTTASVCEIALAEGGKAYSLDPSVLRVFSAYTLESGVVNHLTNIDRFELDRIDSQWRAAESGIPSHVIVDNTSIQIHPPPDADRTLYLEVFRLPLDTEKMTEYNGSPVIALAHHRQLYHWALNVAYGKRDVSMFDPDRAKKHEAEFTDYFGPRPDADLKRKQMTNRPHRNKPW